MVAGRSKLFSSIVVLGAQITAGCGGEATDTSRAGPGGTGGASAGSGGTSASSGGSSGAMSAEAPRAPEDCARPENFVCDDYTTLSRCRCDRAIEVPPDCPPQRLDCTCTPTGGVFFAEPCTPDTRPTGKAIACTCRDTGPLVPTDCPATAEFDCVSRIEPGANCTCDANAPLVETDCSSGRYFTCWKTDPPVGCRCITMIR
ncbi:MAG TPA: hypothetical protein VHE30_21585 [Polyangiaceae bacterium]|nr:hypothetical protein [Polyangiaceae bacterium]